MVDSIDNKHVIWYSTHVLRILSSYDTTHKMDDLWVNFETAIKTLWSYETTLKNVKLYEITSKILLTSSITPKTN